MFAYTRSMADCFYNTEQQRSTKTFRSKPVVHTESSDMDFSSIYTAKSGTPLMYKMREIPENGFSNMTVSITPIIKPTVNPFSTPLKEDISSFENDSSICNKFNIRQCLTILNQEMCSLGLSSLFSSNSETVDIVQFINNAFHLVKQLLKYVEQQSDLYDIQKKLETDNNHSFQLIERLKADLDDSERLRTRLELTSQQLRANVRDLSDKLKAEKDEVRRLDCVMHSRESQYKHESRKKEQEFEKMKERMRKLITDKTNKKTAGFHITSIVEKPNWNDTDWYRSVVGAYEEHEKVILAENNDLKCGLVDLLNELRKALMVNLAQLDDNEKEAFQQTEDGSKSLNNGSQSTTDYISPACYDLPYSAISADVLADVKQKCQLLKEFVNKDCENDRSKMKDYKSFIEQHRQFFLQSIQSAANESTDVSFLVETNDLDARCETRAREALLQQHRLQLEEEHQKLVDYAADLARQRNEIEQMRIEVMHKEFLLLSPFHSSKKLSISVKASPYNLADRSKPVPSLPTPQRSHIDDLPSTVDLMRQLGIFNTENDGDFMSETRSAIREGLEANGRRMENEHERNELRQSSADCGNVDCVKTVLFKDNTLI